VERGITIAAQLAIEGRPVGLRRNGRKRRRRGAEGECVRRRAKLQVVDASPVTTPSSMVPEVVSIFRRMARGWRAAAGATFAIDW